MKRKVGLSRRIAQVLRIPLAGPIFRIYAPRRRWKPRDESARRHPSILIANLMPSLGDTICYMALVEAIRDSMPSAQITWLADSSVAALVAQHPEVDRVLTVTTPPSFLDRIPVIRSYYRLFELTRAIHELPLEDRFDVALVPRGGVDPSFSAQAVWMLNLPISAGCSHRLEPTDTEHSFPDSLFTHLESRIVALHESGRSVHLLELANLVPDALQRFNPRNPLRGLVEIARRLDPTALLNKVGIPYDAPFIVLSPFAGHPKREWPPYKFRELARTIVAETNFRVVLTGTGKDRSVSNTIAEGLGDRVTETTGMLDLWELIALIARASAFVGNDSGAGHIAGALGLPVVSLHVQAKGSDPFHKSSPEQCGPLGSQVTILRPDRFLPPCEVRCESNKVHCLEQISVQDVWHALQAALKDNVKPD